MPAPLSIPLVDIGPYLSENATNEDRRETARSIHTACWKVGVSDCSSAHGVGSSAYSNARCTQFFYLKGHGVPKERMDEVLKLSRAFFARPTEEKEAISISKEDMARGYQSTRLPSYSQSSQLIIARSIAGTGENVTLSKPDWHEGLDLYAPSPFPKADPTSKRPLPPLSGTNQFPAHPAELRRVLEDWIETMQGLGEVLMRATADGLGMDAEEAEALVSLTKQSFW